MIIRWPRSDASQNLASRSPSSWIVSTTASTSSSTSSMPAEWRQQPPTTRGRHGSFYRRKSRLEHTRAQFFGRRSHQLHGSCRLLASASLHITLPAALVSTSHINYCRPAVRCLIADPVASAKLSPPAPLASAASACATRAAGCTTGAAATSCLATLVT